MQLFMKFFNFAFSCVVKLHGFFLAKSGSFNYWISRRVMVDSGRKYNQKKHSGNSISHAYPEFCRQRQIFERLWRFIHALNIQNFFRKKHLKGGVYG